MGKNRNSNYSARSKVSKQNWKPSSPPKSKEARENWNKYNAKNEEQKVII